MSKDKNPSRTIALNKKAKFDYHIVDRFEAGMALQGWELKSIRAGKVQLRDSYVTFHQEEAFLFGAHISPLLSASTHVICDPTRTRKLLLHRRELDKLMRHTTAEGFTCVALAMYWKGSRVKLEIAIVRGKKDHDKRQTIKEREWNQQKSRVLKASLNR